MACRSCLGFAAHSELDLEVRYLYAFDRMQRLITYLPGIQQSEEIPSGEWTCALGFQDNGDGTREARVVQHYTDATSRSLRPCCTGSRLTVTVVDVFLVLRPSLFTIRYPIRRPCCSVFISLSDFMSPSTLTMLHK